jgi:hypothetical protein
MYFYSFEFSTYTLEIGALIEGDVTRYWCDVRTTKNGIRLRNVVVSRLDGKYGGVVGTDISVIDFAEMYTSARDIGTDLNALGALEAAAMAARTREKENKFQREQRYQILPVYTHDGVILARVFQGSTDTDYWTYTFLLEQFFQSRPCSAPSIVR